MDIEQQKEFIEFVWGDPVIINIPGYEQDFEGYIGPQKGLQLPPNGEGTYLVEYEYQGHQCIAWRRASEIRLGGHFAECEHCAGRGIWIEGGKETECPTCGGTGRYEEANDATQ